jgi:hypothetical protein
MFTGICTINIFLERPVYELSPNVYISVTNGDIFFQQLLKRSCNPVLIPADRVMKG